VARPLAPPSGAATPIIIASWRRCEKTAPPRRQREAHTEPDDEHRGHAAISLRAEVDDDVVAALAPLVGAAEKPGP